MEHTEIDTDKIVGGCSFIDSLRAEKHFDEACCREKFKKCCKKYKRSRRCKSCPK